MQGEESSRSHLWLSSQTGSAPYGNHGDARLRRDKLQHGGEGGAVGRRWPLLLEHQTLDEKSERSRSQRRRYIIITAKWFHGRLIRLGFIRDACSFIFTQPENKWKAEPKGVKCSGMILYWSLIRIQWRSMDSELYDIQEWLENLWTRVTGRIISMGIWIQWKNN